MEACPECIQNRTALAREFRELQPLFVALGDETRQRIFLSLLEADQVGLRTEALAERTHLSRPSVSHHLRVLREAGVVGVHRVGTRNYYYARADSSRWKDLLDLANHIYAVVQFARGQGYPNLEEP